MIVVLLAGAGLIAYVSMAGALQDEIDTGLRFRAASAEQATGSIALDARLQESREAFEQLLDRAGTVQQATPGFAEPLLGPAELAALHGLRFSDREVPGVASGARLLAVPVDGSRVLVLGVSTSDRADALHELIEVLALGGAVAVVLACAAAWLVAGVALRPAERMRIEASAISASGADRRMSLPRSRDELHRLAHTLNSMLDRVQGSLAAERAFLELAGHELRTPLAALRAEVDLALRHERSAAELTAALTSVADETDRLARLADDLLVLSRATEGRLPLRRENANLDQLLRSATSAFRERAAQLGVELSVTAPPTSLEVDPIRIKQLLGNLVDNALRHTPRGGRVSIAGSIQHDVASITVSDSVKRPRFDAASF